MGISLWQHKVIKNYQRQHSDKDYCVDGWLQAKNEIARLIDESLQLKRTRTHKRIARYREAHEQMSPKVKANEPAAIQMRSVTTTCSNSHIG
jgi:hypothetical protein